jgi:hypothetical protein
VASGAADGRPSLSRFFPLERGSGPRLTGAGMADVPGGTGGLLPGLRGLHKGLRAANVVAADGRPRMDVVICGSRSLRGKRRRRWATEPQQIPSAGSIRFADPNLVLDGVPLKPKSW